MPFNFSSNAALQALITKVESLLAAVSQIANTANTTAVDAGTSALEAANEAAQALNATKFFGTCSTAAATAAKVVTVDGFQKVNGNRVAVKFSAANTAASPTLNVSGTGAHPIYIGGVVAASGDWNANEVCLLEYNDSSYHLIKTRPGGSWTSMSGACPISKGGTGATTAAAALAALGGAQMALYTASIGTSWTANSSGGYMLTVSVSGIKSTDVPVVGVQMSSDVTAATNQGKAFACINRITTANNSITCYAFNSAPTTAITIQLLVVRQAA